LTSLCPFDSELGKGVVGARRAGGSEEGDEDGLHVDDCRTLLLGRECDGCPHEYYPRYSDCLYIYDHQRLGALVTYPGFSILQY
jgi:hypothetical protein